MKSVQGERAEETCVLISKCGSTGEPYQQTRRQTYAEIGEYAD